MEDNKTTENLKLVGGYVICVLIQPTHPHHASRFTQRDHSLPSPSRAPTRPHLSICSSKIKEDHQLQ